MAVRRICGLSSPESAVLEGAYTGALIYWFWYRSDTGMQYRETFLWIYGVLALLAFTATMADALTGASMAVGDKPHILSAGAPGHAGIQHRPHEVLVFLGFFAYALAIQK